MTFSARLENEGVQLLVHLTATLEIVMARVDEGSMTSASGISSKPQPGTLSSILYPTKHEAFDRTEATSIE